MQKQQLQYFFWFFLLVLHLLGFTGTIGVNFIEACAEFPLVVGAGLCEGHVSNLMHPLERNSTMWPPATAPLMTNKCRMEKNEKGN